MATTPSPFVDHAAPILAGDPELSNDQRADLWDAFATKNPEELVQHLQPLAIPEDTKNRLYQAKQASMPAPDPLDKVSQAVSRISQLDPQIRETAEAHPNLLKAFVSAATTPEKGPAVDSGASASKSKGKTASGSKEAAGQAAVPTPDVPAVPAGHALVKASDGALYHIPHANLEHARSLDKNLSVLHVEP
jgi:hypothetical protein